MTPKKRRPPAGEPGSRPNAFAGRHDSADVAGGTIPAQELADRYGLTVQEVRDFLLMARYRYIVEKVMAESTDADPATRPKVIAAIRAHLEVLADELAGRVQKQLGRRR